MISRILVVSICVVAVFFASQPVMHNQYHVHEYIDSSSAERSTQRFNQVASHTVSLFRLHRSFNGNASSSEVEIIYEEYDDEIVKSPPRIVALTFDDGPSIITDRILDILEYHDVVATFCVLGSRIARYESTLIRTHEAGHEIIGHSWNHARFTQLSRANISEQLVRTNNEIYRVLGVTPAFHRPPYGLMNNAVIEISEDLDLAILMWSVDPRDWEYDATPESIYEHIMDHIFDGSILLFHDIHEVTIYAIDKLVPSLLEQGFVFMTASELLYYSDYPIEGGNIFRYAKPRPQ